MAASGSERLKSGRITARVSEKPFENMLLVFEGSTADIARLQYDSEGSSSYQKLLEWIIQHAYNY